MSESSNVRDAASPSVEEARARIRDLMTGWPDGRSAVLTVRDGEGEVVGQLAVFDRGVECALPIAINPAC